MVITYEKKSGDRQAGAALLLALLMISILSVLVLETVRAVQVEGAGARYFKDSFQAEALAKSGVYLAMALLKEDGQVSLDDPKNDVDHLGEKWSKLLQPENLPPELEGLGELKGQVTDESGKFPINFLVNQKGSTRQGHRQVLQNLLINAPFEMEAEEAKGLIDAIKDWLDEDDLPTGEFGAEADYYQTLDEPYDMRNGPLQSLAELQLVRGMDADLYFGREGSPGLKDLLTIHSDGRININTAGSLVLQALVSPSHDLGTRVEWAESVMNYREEPMHWDFLKESGWYREVPGVTGTNLSAAPLTTKSAFFSVQMTGKVGAGTKSVFAYLERQKPEEEGEGEMSVLARFWQVY